MVFVRGRLAECNITNPLSHAAESATVAVVQIALLWNRSVSEVLLDGCAQRGNVIGVAANIDYTIVDHVPHRHQHSSRLQPSCVAGVLALEVFERLYIRVSEDPCLCCVGCGSIALLVGKNSVEAVLLPSDPSCSSIEECDICVAEAESFDSRDIRVNRIEFDRIS